MNNSEKVPPIKLTYALSHADFLEHQLYIASLSESIQKKRRRNRWSVALIYTLIGVLLFLFDGHILFIEFAFFAFAILWLLFYPAYSRRRYRKHYSQHLRENYQKRIGSELHLQLNKEHIEMQDESGEAKIKMQEIEQLVELPQLFLIRLEKAVSIIIPTQAIADPAAFRDFFQQLNIPFSDQTNWQWR